MKDIKMIYREVISKRLARKKAKLAEVEKELENVSTGADKRKFIELKAVVNELENILDIADSLFELEGNHDGKVHKKDS